MISLFRDGLSKGEYEQYTMLLGQYEYRWLDGHIASFKNSTVLESMLIQAKEEPYSLKSLLKGRQNFEEFIARWWSRVSALTGPMMQL